MVWFVERLRLGIRRQQSLRRHCLLGAVPAWDSDWGQVMTHVSPLPNFYSTCQSDSWLVTLRLPGRVSGRRGGGPALWPVKQTGPKGIRKFRGWRVSELLVQGPILLLSPLWSDRRETLGTMLITVRVAITISQSRRYSYDESDKRDVSKTLILPSFSIWQE